MFVKIFNLIFTKLYNIPVKIRRYVMNINVCLDHERFNKKPDKRTIAAISNRIAQHDTVVEMEEFSKAVGDQGQSFTPAIFNNHKRSRDNFKEMQLFVLDFDGGISYQSVREKCSEFQLDMLFSYKTFSYMEEYEKFRIIFCHEVPIYEKWVASMMLEMFKFLFPEADPSCFEVARIFLGGKGVIEYYPDCTFRLDQLVYLFQRVHYVNDSINYKRNIERFASRYRIALSNNGIIDIFTYQCGELEEKKFNSIIYSIELNQNSSKIVIYGDEKKTQLIHHNDMCANNTKIQHVTVKKMKLTCRLCSIYFSGEHLEHQHMFLLATNMIHIKGMAKPFLAMMENNPERYKKWKFDLRYIEDRSYKPMSCDGNCPYANDCCYDTNICLTIKGRRKIKKINDGELYVSVEESYSCMESSLREAFACMDNDIHLIKGQTGLGKSYAYKKLLGEITAPTIVALPTIKLKNEIYEGLKNNDIQVYNAISLQELCMPPDISESVTILYERGLYKEAKKVIWEYADSLDNEIQKRRYYDFLKFKDFLNSDESKGHIVMTHAYLLQMSDEQLSDYRIIIDEDILATMLKNTKSVSMESLRIIRESGLVAGSMLKEVERVIQMENQTYTKMRSTAYIKYIEKKNLDELGIYDNINELFCAGAAYKNDNMIEYFVPQKLPEKKVIIMSATLNEAVYRLFFNTRRIKVYDTPKAHYRGKLYQYSYYSMSRRDILSLAGEYESVNDLFQKLTNIIPAWDYGISFKDYDRLLKGGMHFGNAAGIDQFKGKDGIIIGTPHLTESSYKLIACYLDIPVNGDSAKIYRQKIQHHGYEFFMMTYGNECLREIQLYMIGSELEQCIGRSRLLREDANVYLFVSDE